MIPEQSWLPLYREPTFAQQMFSDYGVLDERDTIQKEFLEEIQIITELMDELDIPTDKPKWQGDNGPSPIYDPLNRRAMAMRIWGYVAKPIRISDERFVTVSPSNDVMGTPIIQSLDLNQGVDWWLTLADGSIGYSELLERSARRWRVMAIFAAVVAVLLGIVVFL